MKDGDGDFDTDDLKKLIEGHIKNLIISLYIGFTLEEYNLLYDISGKDYIPPDDIPPDDIPPNKDEKYFNKVSVNSSYKGLIPRSYILSTYYTILFETQCASSNDKTQLRSIKSYKTKYFKSKNPFR